MKLILCTQCQDVVKLVQEWQTCVCGIAGGKYLPDGKNAIINGYAVPIGLNNITLAKEAKLYLERKLYGGFSMIAAWVFDCDYKGIRVVNNRGLPAELSEWPDEAFDLGRDAGRSKLTIDDNPYPEHEQLLRESWEDGWEHGNEEIQL